MLAAAAFDGEAHHAYARDEVGIRSTVIPINPRGHAGPPGGKYRSRMPARFRPKRAGSRTERGYGRRWQAESALSRHKRRLGSTLAARSDGTRERACQLRVLTHNLMPLAAHG